MVDSRRPSVPSSDDRAGVAALEPEFDLAVSASTRRSAPPIGSLSPQGTTFGPKPFVSRPASLNSQPARSPSLMAADFLAECETHNVAARDFSNRLVPHTDPITVPHSQASASSTHLQHPEDPNTSHSDFDLFGLASLDLGPPVFEPPYPSLTSTPNVTRQSDPFHQPQPPPPHLSDGNIQVPPHLSNGSLSMPSLPTSSPPPPAPPARSPSLAGNGSASPTRSAREQAHPTRCVLLRNIPPGIDDDDIRRLLQVHGPLRDLGAQQRSRGGRGSVLATYYDLRHARAAVRALDQAVHFGRRLDARFQCPSDVSAGAINAQLVSPNGSGPGSGSPVSPCANQGTLVVFNLDNSTSAEEIRALFSTVGDVKEIRATPNKKHHKFVEFYDVRDAERAMKLLNKTEVAGKRIKIEISRPGGRAGNIGRHAGSNAPNGHQGQQHHHQQPLSNHSGQQRHHANPLSHVPYQQDGAAYRNTSPRHQALEGQPISPHVPAALLSSISRALPAGTQHAGFAHPRETGPFDARVSVSHALPTLGIRSPGFESAVHTLQPSSYEGAFSAQIGNDDEGLLSLHPNGGYDMMGSSRVAPTVPDQRADLQQMYANHVADMNKIPGATVMQNAGPRFPAESYVQGLYTSPRSEDGHKSVMSNGHSPGPRPPFSQAKADCPSTDVTAVNLCKNSFGDEGLTSNFSAAQAASSGAVGQTRKVSNPHHAIVSPTGERGYPQKQVLQKGNGHTNQSSGNKQYLNQQQSQQQQQANAKYALDIEKVRTGEETRTALMIRNIPNKYNQKMLLSTLEEEHRGHFDFIYLPIDFKNKCNVGYAFINFTKPEYIEPFYNRFHGKKWGRFNSEKVCEITFARIQGRQQLIAHFQNSSLLLEDPKCRPVIFDSKGRQEEFPIGSHVRTRRGPSSRDAAHRSCEASPPYSPKHRTNRN